MREDQQYRISRDVQGDLDPALRTQVMHDITSDPPAAELLKQEETLDALLRFDAVPEVDHDRLNQAIRTRLMTLPSPTRGRAGSLTPWFIRGTIAASLAVVVWLGSRTNVTDSPLVPSGRDPASVAYSQPISGTVPYEPRAGEPQKGSPRPVIVAPPEPAVAAGSTDGLRATTLRDRLTIPGPADPQKSATQARSVAIQTPPESPLGISDPQHAVVIRVVRAASDEPRLIRSLRSDVPPSGVWVGASEGKYLVGDDARPARVVVSQARFDGLPARGR